jgi:hypothetical protein
VNLPQTDIRFASLGNPRRVWAVSAIHGELEKLCAIHDAILERLQAGDRIVYLGNYTGYGIKSRETIDEILTFRRLALSQPGVLTTDLVYLRGRQEDMWQKLLQLQFTHKPELTLGTMLEQGLEATLESYGLSAHDGMRACKEGVLALSRWTTRIREALRKNPGHDLFLTQHRRAAYTMAESGRFPLLFVNAGIDPARTLTEQDDAFWWAGEEFSGITQAYAPFEKIIRGYDPHHEGVRLNCVTASLDGGSGFGGNLIAGRLDNAGRMLELLQA